METEEIEGEVEHQRLAGDGELGDLLAADAEIFAADAQAGLDAAVAEHRVLDLGVQILRCLVLNDLGGEGAAEARDVFVPVGRGARILQDLPVLRGRAALPREVFGGALFGELFAEDGGNFGIGAFRARRLGVGRGFCRGFGERVLQLFAEFGLGARVRFRLHAQAAPIHRAAEVAPRRFAGEPLVHVDDALHARKFFLRDT